MIYLPFTCLVMRVYDSGWMRRASCLAIVGLALLWPTLGQSKTGRRVTVVTICEIIDNPKLYAGSPVAVVGSIESGGYLIDRYQFLVQDGCKHPVTAGGKIWPNTFLSGLIRNRVPGSTKRQAGTSP